MYYVFSDFCLLSAVIICYLLSTHSICEFYEPKGGCDDSSCTTD